MTLEQVLNEMRQRIEDECEPGIENLKTWIDVIEAEIEDKDSALDKMRAKLGERETLLWQCRENNERLQKDAERMQKENERVRERLKAWKDQARYWENQSDNLRKENIWLEAEIVRLQKVKKGNEELREALEELFEDTAPTRCSTVDECVRGDRCGRGAYETPLENAAGGCWFSECGCMSEVQQKAAALLDRMDRATLAATEEGNE